LQFNVSNADGDKFVHILKSVLHTKSSYDFTELENSLIYWPILLLWCFLSFCSSI